MAQICQLHTDYSSQPIQLTVEETLPGVESVTRLITGRLIVQLIKVMKGC